jgi:DNA-binding GntR family transcriptional regulator
MGLPGLRRLDVTGTWWHEHRETPASTTYAETRGAASATVVIYLRDLILRDELQPGDRIRQEEIAERIAVTGHDD